jgi:hypothetical protein
VFDECLPIRHLPIVATADGVELRGEISALYPNDITVIITVPVRGLSSHTHIPSFAMGARAVGTGGGSRTTGITPYGRQTAVWLLKRCYEYSQGKRDGWRVEEDVG